MILTAEEQALLEGRRGTGKQICMKIVCEMGKMYGAKRLLPIHGAHMDSCNYGTIWDAGLDFVEHLAALGTKVAVPATTNTTSRDILHWKELRVPEDFSEKTRRIEDAYLQMGCIPTFSCAPYQCAPSPHFGENVAWGESNAVNYVNSVLGARTNRYPDLVELCCAVVGRVPEFGLHLTENRAGALLFRLEGFSEQDFRQNSDFALLGYAVGRTAGNAIPVIEGLPAETTHEHLKALSAASAAGGSVALFHAVGITPEAPTLEAAFQGKTPQRVITVTPANIEAARQELTNAVDSHVDLVLLGCPHSSYSELCEIAEKLRGRAICPGTHFWVQTSKTQKDLLMRSGVGQALEAAGVFLMCDACITTLPMQAWGFETIVTNSAKMAHYAPGTAGGHTYFSSLDDCVEAAVTGRVTL